jgi:hypothetical protein
MILKTLSNYLSLGTLCMMLASQPQFSYAGENISRGTSDSYKIQYVQGNPPEMQEKEDLGLYILRILTKFQGPVSENFLDEDVLDILDKYNRK